MQEKAVGHFKISIGVNVNADGCVLLYNGPEKTANAPLTAPSPMPVQPCH